MNGRAKNEYTGEAVPIDIRIRFWIKTVLPPVDEATAMERNGS